MTTEEQTIIQKAFKDGKKIQSKPYGCEHWVNNPCPDWDWDNCEYRIEESDLSLLDVTNSSMMDVSNSSMYDKYVIANNGTTLLRIVDIEYICIDYLHNDILIRMKSGNSIAETENVMFYDEQGDRLKIDTAFDDERLVAEACARVNAQFLIRLVSLGRTRSTV